MGLFTKNKNKEIEEIRLDFIKQLNDSKDESFKILNNVKGDFNREIKILKEDKDLLDRNFEQKVTLEVNKQTLENTKTISDLTEKKGILEAKLSLYEEAFKNMGFDVKDMKEILNKLVDGIVAKNEIKLVNPK